jgi:hypothetical protein
VPGVTGVTSGGSSTSSMSMVRASGGRDRTGTRWPASTRAITPCAATDTGTDHQRIVSLIMTARRRLPALYTGAVSLEKPSLVRTLLAVSTLLLPGAALADPTTTPLVDRNFTLDLFQGKSMGSTRITGMGGAALAYGEGAEFMTLNPAAVAARPATVNDSWEFDFLLTFGGLDVSKDSDNNGFEEGRGDVFSLAGTAGVMLYLGRLGVGASIEQQQYDELGDMGALTLQTRVVRFHLGLALGEHDDLVVGATGTMGSAQVLHGDTRLVDQYGWGGELGFIYRPFEKNWRFGGRLATPLTAEVDGAGCDPNNCMGLILPSRTQVPWNLGLGVAYRMGGTVWNSIVDADFRDERSLTIALDAVLYGWVSGGANVESFTNDQLQRSGLHLDVTGHGGIEAELIPGWWRMRAGGYYEPARVSGVSGRGHITAGTDVRFWQFRIGDHEHRMRVSLAVDHADGYLNILASLGFWH